MECPGIFLNVWSISTCFGIPDNYVLSDEFQSSGWFHLQNTNYNHHIRPLHRFDDSSVFDKGSFHIRKTLEAWNIPATK